MEGSQNIDSFVGAPTGQEKAGESHEQFSERQRKNQTAIKKIKAGAAKKHAEDTALATILTSFLQHKGAGALVLLISRLTARDIPSDVLLIFIALIHAPAARAIRQKFPELPPSSENALVKKSPFTPNQKRVLDAWMAGVSGVCHTEGVVLLRTARDPNGEPTSGLIQLFSLVVRQFLEKEGDLVELENIKSFGAAFFQKIFIEIAKENAEAKRLT